jgi:hypothetical protein
MDKEEAAGEGLFSLKPVGCFWKAFFLVDFGNPPVDAKKIRPNAYSKKRSTRVLARGWEMQGVQEFIMNRKNRRARRAALR